MGLARWFNLLRGDRLASDIAREQEFHILEREDELVAGGMSRESAAREARRQFGHAPSLGEATRDADLVTWLDALLRDVHQAARSLAHSRVFTLVAVASLALGIGANTAIFSLIHAVVLRAPAVQEPERLAVIALAEGEQVDITNPLWEQVRDGQHPFAGVLAYGHIDVNLAESGERRPAQGLWVSGGFFETLGVSMLRGRPIQAGDDTRGCPATTVLSRDFWQSVLGGDPAIVGKTVAFSGRPFEVLGIADPRFTGLESGRIPAFYVPLCASAVLQPVGSFLDNRSMWFLRVIARLKPGQSLDDANAVLARESPAWFAATLPAGWGPEHQKDYLGRRFKARDSVGELSTLRQSYADALYILMGIVGLVLLVACANVANLMLVRAEARERELAVRVALGAARSRIIRSHLIEALLLSLVGASLGAVLAWWGTHVLVAFLSTTREPFALDLGVSLPVLGFTLGAAVLTTLLFGIAPAWRGVRVDPQLAMKAHGRGTVGGRGGLGIGKVLVVAQVALSLVLVTGAALLVGSLRAVTTVDPGFDASSVLVTETNFRQGEVSAAARDALRRRALERLRSVPTVEHVSASFVTPMEGSAWVDLVEVPGRTFRREEEAQVFVNLVDTDYFAALGMRLQAGRDFAAIDAPGAPDVVVINQEAARRFFPGRSPVGATLRMERGGGTRRELQVVGLVNDTKYLTLREETTAQLFLPIAQDTAFDSGMNFVIRARAPSPQLKAAVAAALTEVAPRAVLRFTLLREQVSETVRRDAAMAWLSSLFGALALLLAVVGLYGTMTYSVLRRRTEIGVRLALGAAPTRVAGGILREVVVMLAAGLVLGLAGVLATTRLVEGLLFQLTARDPVAIGGAMLLLGLAGVLAGYLPARGAARLDPMHALREE